MPFLRRCHRVLTIGVLPVLFAISAHAQTAAGVKPKRAEAWRAPEGSIRLDGRLDEEVWLKAQPISDFVQKEPIEGAAPTDTIEIRFVYDDTALFVGARLFAKDLASIQAPLGRRDNVSQAEHLLIEIDSYLDHRTAYAFGVSASGVRLDHYHPGDSEGNLDTGFDPVWDARVRVDDQGWTAEMWIPFSQLRFNRQDQQVWGLNVYRWVPSKNEAVYWVAVPRTEQGWASRFGELHGLDNVRPPRRLEALPYVAGSSTLTANRDTRNPFDDGKNLTERVGADVKVGFGSNLTLDTTFNPDFGQVDADPAEVNLSAFETFFSERRPFFLEGSGLLNSRVSNLFYSRRVGAAPSGSAPGDFVETPPTSTIIGAAKLTGRLPSKTSIGVLGAITAEEHADVFSLATLSRTRVPVAARTGYALARVQQEFGPNASTAAVMATFVHRDVTEGTPLAAILNRNAVAVGGDSLLRFKGGEYELFGGGGITFIQGDPASIARVQKNSAHYFQRPDHDFVIFDPTRTSMLGGVANVSITRVSGTHWLWGANTGTESPEFDPNDMGRLMAADSITTDAWIRYRETQPGKHVRNYSLMLEQANEWNLGGDRQTGFVMGRVNVTWPNFWTTNVGVWRDYEVQDERLTRGGPLMRRPRAWTSQLDVATPSSSQRQASLGVQYTTREEGGFFTRFSGGFSLRPQPRWQVSFNPTYTRQVESQQYISTIEGGRPETFGSRYVFAFVDRSTYSTQIRLNYTFKPDLNLDLYTEPFASSGRYNGFGELVAPRTSQLRTYGTDGSTIVTNPDGTREVTDGASTFALNTRDFKVQSFRSNVVLRWEFRPGSTLYVVWQQNRSATTATISRATPADAFGSLGVPGDNVIAVKASFWFSMR